MNLIKALALWMFCLCLSACSDISKPVAADATAADSNATRKVAVYPLLVADTTLTNAARSYADEIAPFMQKSRTTLNQVDTLLHKDMSDLREKCNFVFYPFSGPDVLYPTTMFPTAETYFLIGLEKTGTPLTNTPPDSLTLQYYRSALYVYFNSSFFRTLSMEQDLDSKIIDGTVPVIMTLLASQGYNIEHVSYKVLTAAGGMADTTGVSSLVEVSFFHPSTPRRRQTLYYLSADISDKAYPVNLQRYLAVELPKHYTVTFLKAASYLLNRPYFSKTRTAVRCFSQGLIGDDSGMPYRYLKEEFDVDIYGVYERPIPLFGMRDFQPDLKALYDSIGGRPLSFRIGYNNVSNWMCARRKKGF